MYICLIYRNCYATRHFRLPSSVTDRHTRHPAAGPHNICGFQMDQRHICDEYLRRNHLPLCHQGGRIGLQHEADDQYHGDRTRCRTHSPHRHLPAGDPQVPHKARKPMDEKRTGTEDLRQAFRRPEEQGLRKRGIQRNHRSMPQNVRGQDRSPHRHSPYNSVG